MNDLPKEKDWKVYSKRCGEWRERYLEKKTREIAEFLTGDDKTPTERFWETEKLIKKEARILRKCLDPHSRSKMVDHLMLMAHYGMIRSSDLDGFSEDLQEYIGQVLERVGSPPAFREE